MTIAMTVVVVATRSATTGEALPAGPSAPTLRVLSPGTYMTSSTLPSSTYRLKMILFSFRLLGLRR